MDWQAIYLSLQLAAWTTVALLVIGVPVAWRLAAARSRWVFLAEAVIALPIVLPPTVLGFYVLLAIGPRSPLGGFYEGLTGALLPFSFEGLLLASILYSLPFAVQPMAASFAAVDRRLIEASWCLGASRLRTFFRVILPLSWPGLLTAATLSFAHTMGEFGVVLMVGGNIPGETRTASISIYDEVQALNYDAAGETAAFLLVLSFLVLSLTYGIHRRAWSLWPTS